MSTLVQASQNVKRLVNNERGEAGMLTFLYIFLLLLIFVYIGIDVYGYMMTKQNLMLAVNETIEIVKAENGFDSTTEQSFQEFVEKLGLDPSSIQVQGTPALVQRGTPVEVRATTQYEAIGLKPFGQRLELTIVVKANGLAHSYIR